MIRLSGRERLAVLLAVVVAALSLACAREVAEPTSTGIPNTGTPTAAAAASPPAARTAPSAVPREPVATVNLDEIKEQAVRDLFDDRGRMVNPDQRLARIAAEHKGGFGGYYFDETDRSTAYVYMLDPSQTEAAKAAFRAAYRGDRQVDRIVPVQGDYAFNDLLEWFHVLDTAMVENGIHPTTGGVREIQPHPVRIGRHRTGNGSPPDYERPGRSPRSRGFCEGEDQVICQLRRRAMSRSRPE